MTAGVNVLQTGFYSSDYRADLVTPSISPRM
jgi:hypothetical protein